AAGEHPVPIDLETLFHPRIGKGDEQHAEQLAGNKISYSVLRIGLLPQLAWQRRESEIVDLSGMGSLPGQMTPLPVPRWEHSGTDEMRLTRERIEMPAGSNRPTLHGAEVNLLDYSNAVMAGFVQLYRLLRRHRDNLLSDDGPLARFAEDETRIILRPTQTYGTLLGESFHPDVLRNALDRDRLFDRLWVGIEHSPHLLRVISSERRDLENGDIPIFTTRPNSCNVWNSVDERISGFIDEPGLVLAQRRIRELSNQNCSEQLSFIRAALSTLAPGRNEVRLPTYHAAEPKSIAEINSLLAAARKIGDRLEATALQTEDQASWIGIVPAKEGSWTLAPLGCDLYDGLPGVALFLAYLGAVTFDDRYRLLAQSAINALRHQMERMRSVSTALGAFDGWGGIIYALTHFAKLWNVPSLLAEVEGIVELLPALIERDEQLDIIGGAAGCIGSLSVLYRCAPSARTLAVAVQCGERLIDRALAMERGVAWNGGSKQTKPLSGFSHGAAGIAWALLELAALTGEERFRTIALRGIEYERSLFSPDVGNWLDLRDGAVFDRVTGDHSNRFAVAWCHGAPGIGLGRLLSLRHLDDSKIRAEIDAALKTTVAQGFGRNHSLCHGDLGNLELLLQASQTLGDRRWSVHLERFASIILESIERDGWLCANPLGLQSPGLMTGLAGIGYELLRLAEPVRVPSILALAPPYIDRAEALRNGQHLSTVNSAFKSAA
ncbi:MAG: type 2 lantipeptide synthetase LanM family protein, partial [Acidobacteriaceae bacterium]|nr:type 2 lantipeptide synthetase LanM family protein [Acidobacteriaceae bacterium]